MGAPSRIRAITRESIPGAPAWMDALLMQLNEGLSQGAAPLNHGLTFGDNHVAQLKELVITAPAPAWTAPTFQNSWVDFGLSGTDVVEEVGYRIDGVRARLRGVAKSGTVAAGTAIFTLPLGFRPAALEVFGTESNAAHGKCAVYADGKVCAEVGNNAYFSLSSVSFDALAPCAFPPLPTGWPKPVSHTLPFVAGVVPVSCKCLENVGAGSGGWPSFDWERGNKSVSLRNVFGLQPGRKYRVQLLLFAG